MRKRKFSNIETNNVSASKRRIKNHHTALFQTFWKNLTEGTYDDVFASANALLPILTNKENQSRAWNHYWSSTCTFSNGNIKEEKDIIELLTENPIKQLWYFCLMKIARANFTLAKTIYNRRKRQNSVLFEWNKIENGESLFTLDEKTRSCFLQEFYWKEIKQDTYDDRHMWTQKAIFLGEFHDNRVLDTHNIEKFIVKKLVSGQRFIEGYAKWLRPQSGDLPRGIITLLGHDPEAYWILACNGFYERVQQQPIRSAKKISQTKCTHCKYESNQLQFIIDDFNHYLGLFPSTDFPKCCSHSNRVVYTGDEYDVAWYKHLLCLESSSSISKTGGTFELTTRKPFEEKLTIRIQQVVFELDHHVIRPIGKLILDYMIRKRH